MRASKFPALWGSFILTACAVAGCDRQGGTASGGSDPWLRAVQTADRLVVYEGLPHQFYERDLLDAERKSKESITVHDFPFYAAPVEVADDDREGLRRVLGGGGTFLPWRGEKKCGGFHPDYLAEWRAGDASYQFLICFGCREVKVYGPGADHRFDLTQEAADGLKSILGKYRKNRPVGQ